jgi:hypothetical protein
MRMKTSKTETAKGLAFTTHCELQHVDASSICPVRPRKGFLRKLVSHDPKLVIVLFAERHTFLAWNVRLF